MYSCKCIYTDFEINTMIFNNTCVLFRMHFLKQSWKGGWRNDIMTIGEMEKMGQAS